MKKIPRAEISTIKQMLYPDKKISQREWNKKNLKSLKDIEEKNKRIKEEKKNFISPEPYKIQKFKNIPSKIKLDTLNWVNREQTNHKILPKTPNINQKRNFNNNRNKINIKEFTLNPIDKPLTSNIETRPPLINKTNEPGEENIYNILNNKTTTMFDKYYANKRKEKTTGQYNYNSNNQCYQTENINNYNYDMNINTNNINQINTVNNGYYNNEINHASSENQSRNEMIEKLIKEYKEKYGSDEALEKMINDYYGKNDLNIEKNKINNDDKIAIKNQNSKKNINNNSNVLLPKISKNYIRENRQLVIDNKVPMKHKQQTEPIKRNNSKHKDYGKVPAYIKKYELEREIKNEEIKRQEEASKYPKGTKLLSEEERLNTLNGLIQNKKELTNQLEKMPITTRTNAVRIRKEELIKKLEEIEKAIDMFSRKHVFVKL
jgi:uncharacterized protein YeaC (DUF1315 family)